MERKRTRRPAKSASEVSPSTWSQKARSALVVSLLLGGMTLAIFLQATWFDFVDYDDSDYVKANPHVLTGLTWENIAWAWRTGHASNWHPLTWLSHMVDTQLFGTSPHGPHLVNIFLHTTNVILLFLVLMQLTGAFWRSAIVAGLFACHPLHVESVAWISERKDVLSTLFLLLTLGAYGKYIERLRPDPQATAKAKRSQTVTRSLNPEPKAQPSGRPKSEAPARAYYLFALLLFAFGLLSKPMLVTLPFLLLLLDYWPLGRVPGQDPASRWLQIRALLIEKVPFFILSAASSVVTFLVQRKGGAVSTSLSFGARLANAVVSYLRYLGKTLWPDHLSVLYPHPGQWPAITVFLCGAVLLGITVGVLLLARQKPYLAVGWLWFLGGLVPVIGLVQVGIQSMADRYMYVPIIGLFIMAVWGLCDWAASRPGVGVMLRFGTAAALVFCAALTLRQAHYWHDTETLFQHAVDVTRSNYLAYNNLGFYLGRMGKPAEAMENYRKALQINPAYEDALNNYGYGLAGQKKYAEAIGYYQAALRVRPNHVEVHNNLGNALSELGRIDEAIQHYEFVLQQKPDHADAHNNLGIALAMKGRLDEAIPHFRDAIRFKPDYASAHSNLGNALAAEHKLEEATREYQESLRLKPDEAQAHNNLGNVLFEQGRLEDSLAQYHEALRLNSDNPEAQYNLGMVLIRQGKRDEALQHLQEALRLRPDYADAKKVLESLRNR